MRADLSPPSEAVLRMTYRALPGVGTIREAQKVPSSSEEGTCRMAARGWWMGPGKRPIEDIYEDKLSFSRGYAQHCCRARSL